MSDSEFYTTESVTDSEFEESLDIVEYEKKRDAESEALLEKMRMCNIRMSGIDGYVLNRWLHGQTTLDEVTQCGRLKKRNSCVLMRSIPKERIDELRDLAKTLIEFYHGKGTHFQSYIDRVTACIIQYEYNL